VREETGQLSRTRLFDAVIESRFDSSFASLSSILPLASLLLHSYTPLSSTLPRWVTLSISYFYRNKKRDPKHPYTPLLPCPSPAVQDQAMREGLLVAIQPSNPRQKSATVDLSICLFAGSICSLSSVDGTKGRGRGEGRTRRSVTFQLRTFELGASPVHCTNTPLTISSNSASEEMGEERGRTDRGGRVLWARSICTV
jgi:hypothetical protein